MVNNTTSTRARLLTILRASASPQSGQSLAASLGVSRVAVWKAVQALVEKGYCIESSPHGYRLLASSDSLYPWEFESREGQIMHWDETDSTMNRAREAAFAQAPAETVILAERQTSGRGTNGKTWHSPVGGLFFTVIRRPDIPVECLHLETVHMQVKLARVLGRLGYPDLALMWPNDIAAHERGSRQARKVAGILQESFIAGYRAQFVNVGVGINVGPTSPVQGSSSLSVSRKAVVQDLLAEGELETEEALREWNARCPLVRSTVSFTYAKGGSGARVGVFHGIDAQGFAVITEESGSTGHYPPGAITLLNKGTKQ